MTNDADRYDADLVAFAMHYSYDCMRAGLRLRCPIVRAATGPALFSESMPPREIREMTLAWLAVQRG